MTIKSTFIWLAASLFAIYELSITNGFLGIAQQLQQYDHHFHSLGLWGITPTVVYAGCQIPAGIIVNKYPVRIILTLAALVISYGMNIYGHAQNSLTIMLAQVLIASGSAFTFVSIAILIEQWFNKHKFSLLFGATQCVGNISVVASNMFLPQFIRHVHGWKNTSLLFAIAGLVLTLILACVTRSRPIVAVITQPTAERLKFHHALKLLRKNKQFWLVTMYAGLLLGTLFNFGSNWLISFQNNFDHNDLIHSARVSSALFLGVAIGNPLLGSLSLRLKSRRTFLRNGALASLGLLLLLIAGPKLSSSIAMIGYFGLGLSCSCAILAYSTIMDILPAELQGIGIGICNTLVSLSGTILGTLIAIVIRNETIIFHNGLIAEKIGLSIFCATIGLALLLSHRIQESFKHEFAH